MTLGQNFNPIPIKENRAHFSTLVGVPLPDLEIFGVF